MKSTIAFNAILSALALGIWFSLAIERGGWFILVAVLVAIWATIWSFMLYTGYGE